MAHMIYCPESKAMLESTNLATMKHKFQNSNAAKILARHDIILSIVGANKITQSLSYFDIN
jgi:hypothetical protein